MTRLNCPKQILIKPFLWMCAYMSLLCHCSVDWAKSPQFVWYKRTFLFVCSLCECVFFLCVSFSVIARKKCQASANVLSETCVMPMWALHHLDSASINLIVAIRICASCVCSSLCSRRNIVWSFTCVLIQCTHTHTNTFQYKTKF